MTQEGAPSLPPPLHQATYPISPELALVDRELAALVQAEVEDEPAGTQARAAFLDCEVHDAMLRMCELSDVNPPQARRGLALTVAVPTLLWAEAVLLVASFVPLGAP